MDKDFILMQIDIIRKEAECGKYDDKTLVKHIMKRLERIKSELIENS